MSIYVRGYEFWDRSSEQGILASVVPTDVGDFCIDVNISIGWKPKKGITRFDLVVCSPRAIISGKVAEGSIFSGLHYIIMCEYDEHLLKQYIETYVESIRNLPYTQQLQKLCQLGHWELEDAKSPDGRPIVTHEVIFHREEYRLHE